MRQRYEHELASTPSRRLSPSDPGPIATEPRLDAGGPGLEVVFMVLVLLITEVVIVVFWANR